MTWHIDKETLSSALGTASIACWLGAQFPQVIQNIKNQNCEGLALVFLISWAAGDLTNLIGCYLTDQLAFQKYLAIYFVFVDTTLLAQFFYYSGRTSKKPPIALGAGRTPSLMVNSPTASPRLQTQSTSRPPHKRQPTRSHNSYDELSHAASAVARAAEALASSRGRRSRSRPKGIKRTLSSRRSDDEDGGGTAGDHDRLADSTASLTSDTSGTSTRAVNSRTSSSHQLRESFSSQQLAELSRSVSRSPVASPSDLRGRPLSRPAGTLEPPVTAPVSRSPENRNSRIELVRGASRARGVSRAHATGRATEATAGLVLLSFVAVVGIRGLGSSGLAASLTPAAPSTAVGRIIWPSSSLVLDNIPSDPRPSAVPAFTSYTPLELLPLLNDRPEHPGRPTSPHHPSRPPPTWQRTVGRVSAWACTVLYLTSRMPQIWKNFTRKSVEGLSILLFVFAFAGNSFYVASILANPLMDEPRPRSTEFILESLPYLIGSGGTLCFDICIVTQAIVYGSSKPLPVDTNRPWHPSHGHRHRSHTHASARHRAEPTDLESAPLLYGSAHEGISSGTVSAGGPGGKRHRSTSAGGLGAASGPRLGLARSRSRMRVAGADDALGLKLGGDSDTSGNSSSEGPGGTQTAATGSIDGLPPPSRDRLRTVSGGVDPIPEGSESGLVLPVKGGASRS